jgi:hypothetical protein
MTAHIYFDTPCICKHLGRQALISNINQQHVGADRFVPCGHDTHKLLFFDERVDDCHHVWVVG